MQEIFAQILGYARGIWNQRWYALIATWVVSLMGWVGIQQLPDEFEATARVHVDTTTILRPLLHGLAVSKNPDEQLEMVQQTLLSRPNLEKVVRMADLDLQLVDELEFEEEVKNLEEDINFLSAGRNNLYTIAYANDDPALAKKVVQSILTLFVETTLGDTREDSDSAQKFLDKQIREYEQRLIAAEQRLKDFKRENVGQMPQQDSDYYQRMQEAQQEYNDASLELRQAEQKAEELRHQVSGEEPTLGVVGTSRTIARNTTSIDERIERLEQNLDELLLRYTENHPDVVSSREILEHLQQQRDEILNTPITAEEAVIGGLSDNPVYQQLKVSLGEADAEVIWLRVRVEEYQKRVEELRELVYVLPEIEAKLAGLNRDYEVTKENYDKLVAKREAARISQEREQSSNDIQFKIIDPPRVPAIPVGPPRILYMSLVLICSVGIGFVVAFLISQVIVTFSTPQDLSRALDLPVLGTVALSVSAQELRKRWLRNISFTILCVSLVMVYVGLISYELSSQSALTQL